MDKHLNEHERSPVGIMSPKAFADVGLDRLVYIRELKTDDPEFLDEASGPSERTPVRLYAIHAADGTRVAVLDSREQAFMGAREYDMEPLSVH